MRNANEKPAEWLVTDGGQTVIGRCLSVTDAVTWKLERESVGLPAEIVTRYPGQTIAEALAEWREWTDETLDAGELAAGMA